MATQVEENGVNISVSDKHENPSKSITFYNPVMKIAREFILSSLGAYCSDRTGKTKCLDAFGASGISGLLWKSHVQFAPLDVTINDVDAVSVANIRSNCAKNGFTIREFSSTEEEIDGKSIEVSKEDANILMHKRQFNFICIDPFGTTVQFLDATFRNVYHKGMVVLIATDIAALFGKCPQVVLRNYGAFTLRTDYTKEMAVRILLAEAARSAAKCNKGFDVVYSVAVEHFVQVGLKIKRGANHGNQAMSLIGQILHCRHCQEWGRLPATNAPIENPYEFLPCKCHGEKPGKTAVVLGPMWLGEIYSSDFVKVMAARAQEYKLSERVRSLLKLMDVESRCPDSAEVVEVPEKQTSQKSHNTDNLDGSSKTVTDNGGTSAISDTKQSGDNLASSDLQCTQEEVNRTKQSSEVMPKEEQVRNVLTNSNGGMQGSVHLKQPGQSEGSMKRPLGVSDNRGTTEVKKRRTTVRVYGENETPMFYYNLHSRGVKKVDVPKLPKLLSRLHSEGFRASKTSFDSHAVRTDASLPELTAVLLQYFPQKN